MYAYGSFGVEAIKTCYPSATLSMLGTAPITVGKTESCPAGFTEQRYGTGGAPPRRMPCAIAPEAGTCPPGFEFSQRDIDAVGGCCYQTTGREHVEDRLPPKSRLGLILVAVGTLGLLGAVLMSRQRTTEIDNA